MTSVFWIECTISGVGYNYRGNFQDAVKDAQRNIRSPSGKNKIYCGKTLVAVVEENYVVWEKPISLSRRG